LDFALDCSVARRSRTSRLTNPAAGAGLIGKNPLYFEEGSAEDEDLIGLSFSGGGTRAAAFSFGVLTEMARTPVRGASASMLDRIGFISGVSGGAVTAAYYSLRKRAALDDFRERFLLRNAEEGLETDLTIGTVGKALAGGIDDSRGFPRWLDTNLFNGATFSEFRETGRPRVWINASDIYSRTPFVFGATAFSAMYSDLFDLSARERRRRICRSAGRLRAGGDQDLPERMQRSVASLDHQSARRQQYATDVELLCKGDQPTM
jgi:predicted acylesterase/phospholipase RssA